MAELGRTTGRDLIITEEMLFIALRILFSRIPEGRDPAYRGSVDVLMSHGINDVADACSEVADTKASKLY